MHDNGEHEGVQILAKSVVRWTLYISLPILIFVFVNANMLITSLFGLEYQSGASPLLILTIGQVFYVSFGIVDQIFLMTGKQKEWVRISAFIFVLTIVLDAIMIPRANIIGASIVSSAMMLLLGSTAVLRLKRDLKFWRFDYHHAKIIAVSLITALITYPVTIVLSFDFTATLFITIVMLCTLFPTFLTWSGLEASDKATIRQLINKNTPHQ